MALLTVKHQHVADHAKGFARWVDRLLRRWSPWHLRDALRSEIMDCVRYRSSLWETEGKLRDSDARRKELLKYIGRTPRLPYYAYSAEMQVDAARRTVHLRIDPAGCVSLAFLADWDLEDILKTRDLWDSIVRRFEADLMAQAHMAITWALARFRAERAADGA